jgi:uncharacterized membrane protein
VHLFSAYVLGALVLAIFMSTLAFLAIEAFRAEVSVHDEHDYKRSQWEAREALLILRARYAEGKVDNDEFRKLSYELEKAAY